MVHLSSRRVLYTCHLSFTWDIYFILFLHLTCDACLVSLLLTTAIPCRVSQRSFSFLINQNCISVCAWIRQIGSRSSMLSIVWFLINSFTTTNITSSTTYKTIATFEAEGTFLLPWIVLPEIKISGLFWWKRSLWWLLYSKAIQQKEKKIHPLLKIGTLFALPFAMLCSLYSQISASALIWPHLVVFL